MAYFMIGNTDLSKYVNQLNITKTANYNAQTNAAGDTVIDYINSKRTFSIGFIPLSDAAMKSVLAALNGFSVSISFRNPDTGALETNVSCIIPETAVEYYTIQSNNVMYNAFTVDLVEL